MRADREIILWLAIGFFTISSTRSDFGEGMCSTNKSITRTRSISYQETRSVRACWLCIWYNTEIVTLFKIATETIVINETCCEGYENKTGTCRPQCSPTCVNGYCAKPNICSCHHGWGGDSCVELLSCFVHVNLTEAPSISENSTSKGEQNMSKNHRIKPTSPECDAKCRSQVNSTAFNMTGSANDIYYFIPIDSPCNTVAAHPSSWKKYSNWIGIAAGIVMFVVVVYTAYVIRRKRKIGKKKNDQPPQYVLEEYTEENPIYS